MAFPTVAEFLNSRQDTMSTSHPVDIPAGLEPGCVLILVEYTHNNLDLDGHTPGFERLYRAPVSLGSGIVNINVWGYIFKPAELPILGVERGDRSAIPGGVLNLTSGSNRKSDVYAIAFAEQEIPMSFFLFAQATGGAGLVDPPNLVYSAGAQDVLWWALGVGIGWTPAGFPASYGLHQDSHHFSGTTNPASWGGAIAARELNAASEDPGTFAGLTTSDWYGVTMGVSLAGP